MTPHRLALLAACAAVLATTPLPGATQTQPPAAVGAALRTGATDGPGGLLRALNEAIRRDPSLVATPDAAAGLARAAAQQVSGFVGASLPVYRSITRTIVGAAPAPVRPAVEAAVTAEVEGFARADAQSVAPAPSGPAPAASPGAPGALEGIRLGAFTLYPSVDTAAYYDSNAFATRRSPRADFVTVVSPRAALESNLDRHWFAVSGGLDWTNYATYTSENTLDWRVDAEARLDITDTTQIYLGALASRDHEDRGTPDSVAFGESPVEYYDYRAYGGVGQRIGNVALRVGAAVERLVYEDSTTPFGPVNNADRDRTRTTAGVLARYEADPFIQPFVEALGDFRHYEQTQDDFGFRRSSSGWRVGMGARYRLDPTLTGEVFAGLMRQDYDDPLLRYIQTPAFNFSLRWRPRPGTLLVAYADRSIEETTLPGAAGYVYSVVGLRYEQRLMPNLTGILRASWGVSDFVGVVRTDDYYDASAGVRYRLTQNIAVGLDYRFTRRDANVDFADFSRHQVFLRAGFYY
ncbi:outer membrane beta-barrel protein [Roseomonas sp. HF4]|uniref:outer membrane beta-barrel protein n=1 Tax=Roseomonas sp. HF4 TaxID=2562313 RepID=UPI0014858E48|nr:outer membrane beta-barrel protein [Roseomonas sp. HF4]